MITYQHWIIVIILTAGMVSRIWAGTPGDDTILIAKWQGDKRAAVSLTFDDAQDSQRDIVVPEMNRRGMLGTFYLITGFVDGSRFLPKYIGDDVFALRASARRSATTPANVRVRATAIRFLGKMVPDPMQGPIARAFESGDLQRASRLVDAVYTYVDSLEQVDGPAGGVGTTFYYSPAAHSGKRNNTWVDWRRINNDGHEIGSHGVSHQWMSMMSMEMAEYELGRSHDELLREIPGQRIFTYRYPYASDKLECDSIAKQYYAAGANPVRFIGDPPAEVPQQNLQEQVKSSAAYCIPFGEKDADGYWKPERDRSGRSSTYPTRSSRLTTMQRWVDDTISDGAWLVPVFHGIETDGLNPVPRKTFVGWLDYLQQRRSEIWIAPYGTVQRYSRERLAATVEIQENGAERMQLVLKDGLDNAIYHEPLTLLVAIRAGWEFPRVTQGRRVLPVESVLKGEDYFWKFNAYPDQGVIVIKSGL
jgi:peptidoglycan/xylan/chitin deacetylase (PgdA/CDA1 family)